MPNGPLVLYGKQSNGSRSTKLKCDFKVHHQPLRWRQCPGTLPQIAVSAGKERGVSKNWNIGSRIETWTITEFLGKGGNGVVWAVRNEDGVEGAIKFLSARHYADKKRYLRFRDEIAVLAKLNKQAGILPLLGWSIPDAPSTDDPAWLVTGRATLIRKALGVDSSLHEIVEAIADLAEVLALLHEQGISHRDIKPDNLFDYQGNWALGDFGLVDYPGKEAITGDEKLGPLYYMAPEMLENAAEADGRRADVYSLGKTLWVLASGQNFPPPGELRTDVPQLTLAAQINFPRTFQLDRLLARMTKHDPEARPQMGEVATELRAWLAPHVETAPPENLASVSARIAASAVRFQHAEATRIAHTKIAGELRDKIRQLIAPLSEALAGMEFNLIKTEQGGNNAVGIEVLNTGVSRADEVVPGGTEVHATTAEGYNSPTFVSGLAFVVKKNGIVEMGAAHIADIGPLMHSVRTVLWSDLKRAVLGSADQDRQIEILAEALLASLPASLEAFAGMIEEAT